MFFALNLSARDINLLFFSVDKSLSIFNHNIDFNRLKLSNEQLETLLKIHFNYEKETKKLVFDDKEMIFSFIGKKGFNKNSYLKEVQSLKYSLIYLKAEYLEKLFNILTKEQILILKEMIDNGKDFDDRR